MLLLTILSTLAALVIGAPLMFAMLHPPDTHTRASIQAVRETALIEELFRPYAAALAADLPGYKNHVYRVLSFTLPCLKAHGHDGAHTRELVETALVYHDIGLWTDARLAYLAPSVARARTDMAPTRGEEDMQLVEAIIVNHHKVTPYEGPNAEVVNCVRMGDWVDASFGVVHFGLPLADIQRVQAAIPEEGFHYTLATLIHRIRGWNVIQGLWEFSTIFRI